jgi:hypothetical protein
MLHPVNTAPTGALVLQLLNTTDNSNLVFIAISSGNLFYTLGTGSPQGVTAFTFSSDAVDLRISVIEGTVILQARRLSSSTPVVFKAVITIPPTAVLAASASVPGGTFIEQFLILSSVGASLG